MTQKVENATAPESRSRETNKLRDRIRVVRTSTRKICTCILTCVKANSNVDRKRQIDVSRAFLSFSKVYNCM